MEWWTEVRLAAQGLLEQHGLLAGFLFVLVEEAGVPVPVPGDFLMLLLGVRARQGEVPLWQALVVLEVATLIGSAFLYLVWFIPLVGLSLLAQLAAEAESARAAAPAPGSLEPAAVMAA